MILSVPIYDYHCDHCGHAFSAIRSFSDATIETCPSCGKRPRKLLVSPAIVFKGSGWYKTDSRGKAPSEGGSGGSSDQKGDTAPAAKDTNTSASETKSTTTSTPPPAKSEGSS